MVRGWFMLLSMLSLILCNNFLHQRIPLATSLGSTIPFSMQPIQNRLERTMDNVLVPLLPARRNGSAFGQLSLLRDRSQSRDHFLMMAQIQSLLSRVELVRL